MVLESNLLDEQDGHYRVVGTLPADAIPATLQDSLTARLDRLAPVREIAQLGATIGREFRYDLLAAVSPMPEDELLDALEQLVKAELLHQRGVPPDMVLTFKHSLIRDAAYQSLLKARRQQ
jgi:predicted ATPase